MAKISNARLKILQGLRAYLQRKRTPRLLITFILLLTFTAGFFSSRSMLDWGLENMAIRYGVATIFSWLMFMGMVRLWAEFERRTFNAPEDIAQLANAQGAEKKHAPWEKSGETVIDIFKEGNIDAIDVGEGGEGCLLVLLIPIILFLVFGIVGSLFALISAAPALLAEVFLDAVVVGVLARQLKPKDTMSWSESVFRRTWKCVLAMFLVFVFTGAIGQSIKPHARTIGDLWRDTPDLNQPIENQK